MVDKQSAMVWFFGQSSLLLICVLRFYTDVFVSKCLLCEQKTNKHSFQLHSIDAISWFLCEIFPQVDWMTQTTTLIPILILSFLCSRSTSSSSRSCHWSWHLSFVPISTQIGHPPPFVTSFASHSVSFLDTFALGSKWSTLHCCQQYVTSWFTLWSQGSSRGELRVCDKVFN